MPAAIAVPLISTAVGFAADAVSKKKNGGGNGGNAGNGPSFVGPLISAGVNAGASTYGANKQSQANSRALTFGREQAQNAAENAEITRRANYDQWAARQNRINALTRGMGLGAQEIPAYAPGIMPHFVPRSVGDYVGGPTPPVLTRPVAPHPYRVGDVNSYL